MPTQRDRILAVLMERGEKGVYVYELMTPRPTGLGCAQYNARIKELRSRGYTIVNTEPGHFVLKDSPKEEPETWTAEQLQAELEFMRKTWEITPPKYRKKIEEEGHRLKNILEAFV